MDITFNIEKFEAGIILTIHGREYEIDLQSLDRQDVEIEIDPDELDLHQIDEDTMKNHLESIHGPIYMESEESEMIEHLENCYGEIFREGEEAEMIEHLRNQGYLIGEENTAFKFDICREALENEGYFVAKGIDEAVKRVKQWLKFDLNGEKEFQSKSEAEMIKHLESKGYYIGDTPIESLSDSDWSKKAWLAECVQDLENEGYFVAEHLDAAIEEIEENLYPHFGKWIVDPEEIDEVDTMEFIAQALHKKGYYILKIPSCLKGLIGGSK
tara:strand:- start:575 stop:1384 length:810 start_codon:yes stop_codon:yes gene_type:complete